MPVSEGQNRSESSCRANRLIQTKCTDTWPTSPSTNLMRSGAKLSSQESECCEVDGVTGAGNAGIDPLVCRSPGGRLTSRSSWHSRLARRRGKPSSFRGGRGESEGRGGGGRGGVMALFAELVKDMHNMCVCARACVRMCVRARARVCVCARACVCVRARTRACVFAREGERRGRKGGGEGVEKHMAVCGQVGRFVQVLIPSCCSLRANTYLWFRRVVSTARLRELSPQTC